MSSLSDFKLKYGKEELRLSIPTKNISDVLKPKDSTCIDNPLQEISLSLQTPIGTPALFELAKGKKNVVILCSDITRPAPSHLIVPPILDELNSAGVQDENITIVFALGSHRPHTEEEKIKLVGQNVYNRVKCIDHDPKQCIYLGQSSYNTPIWVFEPVVNSDFIIATGNLEFHYIAGYSGGHKALMPGVCNKETIQANHVMMLDPETMPGKIENNPMRADVEEIGSKVGVKFIVNVILNAKKEIVKAVAGDPILAHREGCKYIDQMYKCPIKKKADIVICSPGGFPKDINLYQAQKGFENASYAVKDGGIIVLAAKCQELLGEKTFEEWMLQAKTPQDTITRVKKEFILGGHKAVAICLVLEKKKTFLVSNLPNNLAKECFFTPFKSIQEALDQAIKEKGTEADIIVMPYANSTLPYLVS